MNTQYEPDDPEEIKNELTKTLEEILMLSNYIIPTGKLKKSDKKKIEKNLRKTLKKMKENNYGNAPYLSQDVRDWYE